jgi:hypothetical protein
LARVDRQGPRLHLHQVPTHPGPFHLKHAEHVPAAEHLVGLGVVERNTVDVQIDCVPSLDKLAGARHHGQGRQAEKVNLEQSQPFQDLHLELSDPAHRVVLRSDFRRAVEGDVFRDRAIGDDDPGGVRAGVAGYAFQLAGGIDELTQIGRGLVDLFESSHAFQCIGDRQRLPGDVGDELGNAVNLRQGDVHHPPHVPDRRPRAQGPESDDLSHLVSAVGVGGILQHLCPAIILEVEIDVGHGHPPRIEEALENQTVGQRIDKRDLQTIGHDRTGGRTAGVVPNPVFSGVATQIPYNQEVGIETHLVDDAQLIIEPLSDLIVVESIRIAPAESLFTLMPQIARRNIPVGNLEIWKAISLEIQIHLASLGDPQSVLDRLWDLVEQRLHLLRRSEVIRRIGHAHPIGVGLDGAGLDAKQDVLELCVFR